MVSPAPTKQAMPAVSIICSTRMAASGYKYCDAICGELFCNRITSISVLRPANAIIVASRPKKTARTSACPVARFASV